MNIEHTIKLKSKFFEMTLGLDTNGKTVQSIELIHGENSSLLEFKHDLEELMKEVDAFESGKRTIQLGGVVIPYSETCQHDFHFSYFLRTKGLFQKRTGMELRCNRCGKTRKEYFRE